MSHVLHCSYNVQLQQVFKGSFSSLNQKSVGNFTISPVFLSNRDLKKN